MFWKKQKSKFIQVKEEIDSHLMDRRLSAAMALFNDFHNIYSSYSEKDKAFYRTEYFQTKSKLTLLMKIEELLQVVKIDNLEKLKDKLNEIEELTNKDIEEMPQRLYNHIAHHFNQSRKIYLYKSKKQELDKIIKNVRNLLTEQNYDVALRLFPEIIQTYNETAQYHINEELFSEIQELKAHIKMSLIKQSAYTKEAETDIKQLKIFLNKKEKQQEKIIKVIEKNTKEQQKLKIKLKNVSHPFKDLSSLRKSISKGDVDKSKKQFFLAFDE